MKLSFSWWFFVLVWWLLSLGGCVSTGPGDDVQARMDAVEKTAQVWKESGARVFAAGQVPLHLKFWTKTEFGGGSDGYIQLFAIWEPEADKPTNDGPE